MVTSKKTVAKAPAKKVTAKKTVAKKAPAKTAAKAAAKKAPAPAKSASAAGLRVRMYRVGFGDFFLVTVPTKAGPRYVLIDCGVHAGNIGTMGQCVQDMADYTKRKLALVILTHYHADHISGFATEAEAFKQFEVESVWITNRLDPGNAAAKTTHLQVAALAQHLQLALGARSDEAGQQALGMAQNALGVAGGSNDKALAVVTGGFKNKPDVRYYEAGQDPVLPKSLQGVLTAQILGPAPKSAAAQYTAADNKAAQYLAAVESAGPPEADPFSPFERHWPAQAGDYPPEAFKPWCDPAEMEAALHGLQPDALAAAAAVIDGTLNNQSLVVLFTCLGKKLLFVGDAQWGNWAYWLYGKPVSGQPPGISAEARDILAGIDFYKVGHHGSTNANPIPAVGALRLRCVGMCSTADKCYNGVPKGPLLDALVERTANQFVRSDWLAIGANKASPDALKQLDKLPKNFTAGKLFIEYSF